MKQPTAIAIAKALAALSDDFDALLAAVPLANLPRNDIEKMHAAAKSFREHYRTIYEAMRTVKVEAVTKEN